jgi:flagellar basal body-associated protein FliL
MANRQKALMWGMLVIILILAAIVVYAFVLSPAVTGYVADRQVEGYQIAISDIVQVVSQCQTFPLNLGENQTINLVALECLQQPPAQQEPLQ